MSITRPLSTDELERSPHYKSEIFQPDSEHIKVTKETVNFAGVELPRSKISGPRALEPKTYKGYIDDEPAVELQRNIAVSWLLGQPMLMEGGTSIGKTETVRRMTSLLGYDLYDIAVSSQSDVDDFLGRPTVNTERTSPDDPEFIYILGELAEGLVPEEGKIKVIFLDEYNAAKPGVIIKFHEIFDKYNKGQLYTLVNGKRVKLDRNNVKIVAATNTPGKGYLERFTLDPAQIRRWNYFKLEDKLDPKFKRGRARKAMGSKESISGEPRTLKNLRSSEQKTPLDELHNIPNFWELVDKIADFHDTAEKLLEEREIAKDQPQRFIYDFNSLMKKISEFIERFYNGNINETVQCALYYYFANSLQSAEDRQKIEELIQNVRIDLVSDSRRINLTPDKTATKQEEKLKPATEVHDKITREEPKMQTSGETLAETLEKLRTAGESLENLTTKNELVEYINDISSLTRPLSINEVDELVPDVLQKILYSNPPIDQKVVNKFVKKVFEDYRGEIITNAMYKWYSDKNNYPTEIETTAYGIDYYRPKVKIPNEYLEYAFKIGFGIYGSPLSALTLDLLPSLHYDFKSRGYSDEDELHARFFEEPLTSKDWDRLIYAYQDYVLPDVISVKELPFLRFIDEFELSSDQMMDKLLDLYNFTQDREDFKFLEDRIFSILPRFRNLSFKSAKRLIDLGLVNAVSYNMKSFLYYDQENIQSYLESF
jgi:MoxR-like ATPase